MPWRCEATSPECDPGGHPADSAAGQSGICPVASSSRFDPRVLPSRRSQGEATYLKLNIALFGTPFSDNQMAGGALGRASLAAGLERLGLQTERDGTAFRVKGISQELCDHFSKRRAEVLAGIIEKAANLEKLKELDIAEILEAARGKMAQLVTLETRRGKDEYTREELFPKWREEARETGIEQPRPEALIRAPRVLSTDDKERIAERIYEKAIDVVTNEHSHWNERELTRRLAEEAQSKGLNARDVRELVHQKLAENHIVRVGEIVTEKKDQTKRRWHERSEERFSTRENLELEHELLGRVERMRSRSNAVPKDVIEGVIDLTKQKLLVQGIEFSAKQAKAIEHVTGENAIACVIGKAGTGKSTLCDAARFAWELAGYRVRGVAVAGVASDALRESANIPSDTLAMTLTLLKHGRISLGKKDILVLDEAGMVPTKLMAELVRHVEEAGAKLVLIGDSAQLQSVGAAGGPFHSISQRIGACELTEIHRQREQWRKKTVEQFSRGEAREALIAYAAQDQLHLTDSRDQALLKLVDLWRADGGHEAEHAKDVLLLASMNHERRTLNSLCQLERLQARELGERSIKVSEGMIFEGDRVVCKKKDRKLEVENGFTGVVIAIDETTNKITTALDKGGREVEIYLDRYGRDKIQLAYCQTVHSSQGSTREKAHVLLGGPTMTKHLAYVAASRCRESCHLVADKATTARNSNIQAALNSLGAALSRDRTKDLAMDVADATRRRQNEQRQTLGISLGL